MDKPLLNLAKSLIEIKSLSPNDEGCFDLIEEYLDELNFKTQRINYLNIERVKYLIYFP